MQRQRLSIAFIEMTNFGALTEAVDDAALAAFLEESFTSAGDVVQRFGGRIVKYIGDAILATFPDPAGAAAAAREIAAKDERERGGVRVRFYVAVATGDVMSGEIGHPSHRAHDVIGKTVNRAAHLLGEAKSSAQRFALCPETQRAS